MNRRVSNGENKEVNGNERNFAGCHMHKLCARGSIPRGVKKTWDEMRIDGIGNEELCRKKMKRSWYRKDRDGS